MFDRRKLLITLCMLACILLAGGFLGVNLLGLASLPLLGSLYAEGWWTLLLIFPSLTMFALDGYSRPALGLLASGLLLFANTHGLIAPGMLMTAALNTALASVAGGAALEITAKQVEKRKNAPLLAEKKKKQLEEKAASKSAGSPFAPGAAPTKPQQSQTSPKPGPTQPEGAPRTAANPYKQAAGNQHSNPYSRPSPGWGSGKANTQEWRRPAKGWDPARSYRNPKDRRISPQSSPNLPAQHSPQQAAMSSQKSSSLSREKKQRGFVSSASYPQSIAIFNESRVSSSHRDLSGGLVISLFGDARLNLREADYNNPITLSALSLFGSSKIEVPYVSNIVLQPISLFGDCRDKRKLVNSNAMPAITIRCLSLFGDCRIM